jgi:hypothetical protein
MPTAMSYEVVNYRAAARRAKPSGIRQKPRRLDERASEKTKRKKNSARRQMSNFNDGKM